MAVPSTMEMSSSWSYHPQLRTQQVLFHGKQQQQVSTDKVTPTIPQAEDQRCTLLGHTDHYHQKRPWKAQILLKLLTINHLTFEHQDISRDQPFLTAASSGHTQALHVNCQAVYTSILLQRGDSGPASVPIAGLCNSMQFFGSTTNQGGRRNCLYAWTRREFLPRCNSNTSTAPLHERAASVAEATVAISSCVECHRNVIFYVIYIQKITKSTLPPGVPTISLNDCPAPLSHRSDVLCVVTNLNFLLLLYYVLPQFSLCVQEAL